jgi:hypothetical protein
MIAGAALAALAIAGFWIAWRQPSYLPPPDDEIDILLELAGVFPDNYGIMWREHQLLRATDPEAQRYPSLLQNAQMMHKLLTTEGGQSSGKISVEVGYRFYAGDHAYDVDTKSATILDGKLAADEGTMRCDCLSSDDGNLNCSGVLGFGNYEFSISVDYREQCANSIKRRTAEFRHSMQTADRLIELYLNPLRRKPRWL